MNKRYCAVLLFALGLGQVIQAATFLPQPTALQELDALATLEDAALGANGTAGGFETAMLGHVLSGRSSEKVDAKNIEGAAGRKVFLHRRCAYSLPSISIYTHMGVGEE